MEIDRKDLKIPGVLVKVSLIDLLDPDFYYAELGKDAVESNSVWISNDMQNVRTDDTVLRPKILWLYYVLASAV